MKIEHTNIIAKAASLAHVILSNFIEDEDTYTILFIKPLQKGQLEGWVNIDKHILDWPDAIQHVTGAIIHYLEKIPY